MDMLPTTLLHDRQSITHPFKAGDRVRACTIPIIHRPVFVRATIAGRVDGTADLYWGHYDGTPHSTSRFFAHPELQTHGAEAALLLQWRATLQPEVFGLDFGFELRRRGLGK